MHDVCDQKGAEYLMRRKLSKAEREQVLKKCDGHCAYCGCSLEHEHMQVDHVIPLRKGGADELENMLPACKSCNWYKSTMTVDQFRAYLEQIPTRLMRDSIPYQVGMRFGIIKQGEPQIKFYFENHKEE